MQTTEKEPSKSLSQLRRELRKLLQELDDCLETVFGRTPLVKGTIYEISRKCGKASCTCTRGQLHKSTVLSWSDQGRTRLKSVPPKRLEELRRKTDDYRRFRQARSRVPNTSQEILAVVDRIESLRREEP